MGTTIPDVARRTSAGAGLRVTDVRRQPRPADPDLANLDRRLTDLEALGDARGRRFAVALLRQKHGFLVRDQGTRLAGWYTDGASLTLAVDREERYRG